MSGREIEALTPYHPEYDGFYSMSWHDQEENALKRWFDNYKVERHATFACETEWLVVKELASRTKRKKRYICEIGDDGRGAKREVIMDHAAPPAPILSFAAKRLYEPPPPKSAAQLRKEAEWDRMMTMGYEPIRRAKITLPMGIWSVGEMPGDMAIDVEYEIEWVRRRPNYLDRPPRIARPAPPPRHRRNA